jgi:nucleoside-diphosphate-sugar epimerase
VARRELGRHTKVSLRDGLKCTVDWFADQRMRSIEQP